MTMNLEEYQKTIDIGSELQTKLVKLRQPIIGQISDIISLCHRIVRLGDSKTEPIRKQRNTYFTQMKEALPTLEETEFPSGASELATQLVKQANILVATQIATQTPTKAEKK